MLLTKPLCCLDLMPAGDRRRVAAETGLKEDNRGVSIKQRVALREYLAALTAARSAVMRDLVSSIEVSLAALVSALRSESIWLP
jgi:hypothetical protein